MKFDDYFKKNYTELNKELLNLINTFRKQPSSLISCLESIKDKVDNKNCYSISDPDVIYQLFESKSIFTEAIEYIKTLKPIHELSYNEILSKSAQIHVDDVGPKGILCYQSSDGLKPEERLLRLYENISISEKPTIFSESILTGPYDSLGLLINFIIDDGCEGRPNRKNLFSESFNSIGIAIGQHLTEYQICVIDFAFINNKKYDKNKSIHSDNIANRSLPFGYKKNMLQKSFNDKLVKSPESPISPIENKKNTIVNNSNLYKNKEIIENSKKDEDEKKKRKEKIDDFVIKHNNQSNIEKTEKDLNNIDKCKTRLKTKNNKKGKLDGESFEEEEIVNKVKDNEKYINDEDDDSIKNEILYEKLNKKRKIVRKEILVKTFIKIHYSDGTMKTIRKKENFIDEV